MRLSRVHHLALLLVLGSFLGLSLAACDNSIEPFVEDQGTLSIYGYLSLSDDKHFVRVKDLSEPLIEDTTRELDATVTLQNRTTGNTEVLADSVVVFDGVTTHNFWVKKDIQPDTEYNLTVEDSDGQVVQATATTPAPTDVRVRPSTSPDLPDGECRTSFRLTFNNISDLRLIRDVSIGFSLDNEMRWISRSVNDISSDAPTHRFRPLSILSSLIEDASIEGDEYCALLDDDTFYIAFTRLGPDWPPAVALNDPLNSETVGGGQGAFGGLVRDTTTVTIDTTVQQ